jgi:FAD binding domain/Pyridine nucleotide-disulphide oxidoreductase
MRGISPGMRSARERPVQCVIAGGSLVGLSAAIALSRLGIDVTVLERSPARADDGGGGLGVDVALLRQVTAISAQPPVVHGIDRDTTGWHLLQGWLETHAEHRSAVAVHRRSRLMSVSPGNDAESAAVMAEDGGSHRADLVLGADGARSTVRMAVDTEHPGARYAGVLLWRIMVDEQALPAGVGLPAAGELRSTMLSLAPSSHVAPSRGRQTPSGTPSNSRQEIPGPMSCHELRRPVILIQDPPRSGCLAGLARQRRRLGDCRRPRRARDVSEHGCLRAPLQNGNRWLSMVGLLLQAPVLSQAPDLDRAAWP